MAFCRNCGHEISDGDLFCSSCGWKVEKKEEAALNGSALQNELKYIDDDSPTVRLKPSEIMADDSPTVKLDTDEPTRKLDTGYTSGGAKPPVYGSAPVAPTPTPYYSGTHTAVNNKQKNKYTVPIIICSFIFALVAFLMIAFCFNLFGFKNAVAELINGDGASQSEETDADDFEDGEEPSTENTTEDTTTEPSTQVIYGTTDNPIIVNGAQKNVSAQIVSQGQCNLKFSPSYTGYYYIQIPVGSKVVTFKTYDSAGNLMGNSEHHKEGSVNEYLYYDMFYAGETYTIVAAGDSGYSFKVSFTDRTNDAHRVIKTHVPIKLTNKYTYLRTFTPETTGSYTLGASPSGSVGTIRLFDANWNDMNFSISDTGYGNSMGEVYLERGKKYHFVFYPAGNLTVSIGPTGTDGM